MGRSENKRQSRSSAGAVRAEPFKRQRKERINQSAYDLPNVDVHGILFAVVALVFVVYPLAQWALGR